MNTQSSRNMMNNISIRQGEGAHSQMPYVSQQTFYKVFKDETDKLFADIAEEKISLDLFNFNVTLPYQKIRIKDLFMYMKQNRQGLKRISTTYVENEKYRSKTALGSELRISRISAGRNYTVSFNDEKLKDQLAYMIWDEGGPEKDKVVVNETDDQVYIQLGVQCDFWYTNETDQPSSEYSVSLYIYNTGKVRATLGFRKSKGEKGNDNTKYISPLSDLVTVASNRYVTIMQDIYHVVWKHVLRPFMKPVDSEMLRRVRQAMTPDRIELFNLSSVFYLKRPWTMRNWSVNEFKVNTSILLDYILTTKTIEEGYIITSRHDRSQSDSGPYFMIDIHYCLYSQVFTEYSLIRPRSDNPRVVLVRDVRLNPKYWRITGDSLDKKQKLEFLDRIHKELYLYQDQSKVLIQIKRNKTKMEAVSTKEEYEAVLIMSELPKVATKVYTRGTIQMSGINSRSPYPWYTMWRTIVLLCQCFTETGWVDGIRGMFRSGGAFHTWLQSLPPTGTTLLDLDSYTHKDEAPARTGLKDANIRRGRKEVHVCQPASRAPEPKDFTGTCKDVNMYVRPNKYGTACCFVKPKKLDRAALLKIKQVYTDAGVSTIPNSVREMFPDNIVKEVVGHNSNDTNKDNKSINLINNVERQRKAKRHEKKKNAATDTIKTEIEPGTKRESGNPEHHKEKKAVYENDNKQGNNVEEFPEDGGVVHIHPRTGHLVVNGRQAPRIVLRMLEPIATQMGIPLVTRSRRTIKPKSLNKLIQDIVIQLLIEDGIPKLKKSSRDKAIKVLIATVKGKKATDLSEEDNAATWTYKDYVTYLKKLLQQKKASLEKNKSVTNHHPENEGGHSPYYYNGVFDLRDASRQQVSFMSTKVGPEFSNRRGATSSTNNKSLNNPDSTRETRTNREPNDDAAGVSSKVESSKPDAGSLLTNKDKMRMSIDAYMHVQNMQNT